MLKEGEGMFYDPARDGEVSAICSHCKREFFAKTKEAIDKKLEEHEKVCKKGGKNEKR